MKHPWEPQQTPSITTDGTTHPTDLDTLLKEERAKNERLEEGIAYLRGIEQRNNELIDALLARAEAAEASALTARRDALEEAARESVALWMIQHSIATGHGDTLDDLLRELLASARRDALEEAAKVADREEAECRDAANGTVGEHAYWTPCANTARLIAKDIRTLASTVPGGEETANANQKEPTA